MQDDSIQRLKKALDEADSVLIGAGAGMSTAAGFTYTGKRFERYFHDFSEKYGFTDMYSGGFYPFEELTDKWAYWSRYIWINRYMKIPGSIYSDLFELVRAKDHFVLTTNVDHCFIKAGFDKKRLFYTQGDYGLFQCSKPCCRETWDNGETIRDMVLSQGYTIGTDGDLLTPTNGIPAMKVPETLVPKCPRCGRAMEMNLRADDTFVQDKGWDAAAARYEDFTVAHSCSKILYLEIGVGYNTPGIIKYNFWRQVFANQKAIYACLNYDDAYAPAEIRERSILIEGDSAAVIAELRK